MEYKQKHPEFPLDNAWNDPVKIHYFIGDDIKDIEYNRENDYTIIKTKNLIGVENGDYIVIEEIGHTTDLYDNGKKMKIFLFYLSHRLIVCCHGA